MSAKSVGNLSVWLIITVLSVGVGGYALYLTFTLPQNASLDEGLTRWQRLKARISLRSLGGYSVRDLFKR